MKAPLDYQQSIVTLFIQTRRQTQKLCEPLEVEDFVVQPVKDVSPLKWHLGHTTWFFETFILKPNQNKYTEFHPKFSYLFNSYYIAAGDRWSRENRGQLTRPTLQEILDYRQHVEHAMQAFLHTNDFDPEVWKVVELGCHHEQQHQELFLYDIKRILGDNPLFPIYQKSKGEATATQVGHDQQWHGLEEGVYEVGHEGNSFHFDNEKRRHKVFIHACEVATSLVTNGQFLEFIESGGYQNHSLWLSEGWDWVNENGINAPRYWHAEDKDWRYYTLGGYREIEVDAPVAHISYYEADAFARWMGCRLPTEQEWEVACVQREAIHGSAEGNFMEQENFCPIPQQGGTFLGNLWQWTSSAYLPYPGYDPPVGALGEYNGKFMINQMVLRGGSFGTPRLHIRPTYRNFFHPYLRWMFTGIRLARHI